MQLYPSLLQLKHEMSDWRHRLHARPETAFEEHTTAAFVAEKLSDFGLRVETGLAVTGVVGTLQGMGTASRSIALRADMDALHIDERADVPFRSKIPGKMHACGHDGHTAMLLGAAKYLAATKGFAGTVHFVFQPAEENEGGGRRMIEEGLFKKFNTEQIYGLHNWPGLKVGRFSTVAGPMLASYDIFEIIVEGRGCHAAMPHLGIDPIIVSAHIITELQTIPSRMVAPQQPCVLSVTQVHGGDTWNVIPDQVTIRGTVRTFQRQVQDLAEEALHRVSTKTAEAFGAKVAIRYERRYPPVINTIPETGFAVACAEEIAGPGNVDSSQTAVMNSEDFAYMLQERPGCYMFIGNGSDADGCRLHSPYYRFNDDILPFGASYWVKLVERSLPLT